MAAWLRGCTCTAQAVKMLEACGSACTWQCMCLAAHAHGRGPTRRRVIKGSGGATRRAGTKPTDLETMSIMHSLSPIGPATAMMQSMSAGQQPGQQPTACPAGESQPEIRAGESQPGWQGVAVPWQGRAHSSVAPGLRVWQCHGRAGHKAVWRQGLGCGSAMAGQGTQQCGARA
jgi:hypothetical protein